MPPTSFKRSRALWENAREQYKQNHQYSNLLRAILYELQPIRFREIDGQQWKQRVHWFGQTIRQLLTFTGPSIARRLASFMLHLTLRQWAIALGIVAYYWAVRWIHEYINAGPIVLILTALVAIFTIGLGDDVNPDGFSAYSVFNRGMQRMLGDVDVDALLAQHVGGGMMELPPRHDEVDNRPNARAAPLRRPAPERPPSDNDESENSSDDDAVDQHGRARRSRKKRGRNREQRLEMRRQREAAAAFGFGNDELGDVVAMRGL
jgi:hypothetical protein